METHQTAALQLPSLLHGTYLAIKSQAEAEGRRCARHHQRGDALPRPEQLLTVASSDVVFTHSVADFRDEQPAWRLYMVSEVVMSLCEADAQHHRQLAALYESTFLETPWGALYFALSGKAPESAERVALRLKAVLRSWDSLRHGRYLHKKLSPFLDLEQLLTAACGWAMEAWCPEGGSSVRSRLEEAAERMARATRADCIEAILRHLPQLLLFADGRKLHHPEVVTDLACWREHLAMLEDAEFERISAASPSEVLGRLYGWDRQLVRAASPGSR